MWFSILPIHDCFELTKKFKIIYINLIMLIYGINIVNYYFNIIEILFE